MFIKAVKLTKKPVPIGAWLGSFLAVVMVRVLLENFSSPGAFGSLDGSVITLVHYGLFYLGLALALVLVAARFSRVPVGELVRLVPYLLPIIWLPPLADLLFSGGVGAPMSYVYAGVGGLVSAFLTFFGNPEAAGITNGIRLELVLIILAVFLFVRKLRQAWRPAVLAALSSYLVIFFWLCLPSWLYLLSGASGHQPIDFLRLVSGSSLTAFSLNDLSVGLPPDSALALFINALMGRLNLLLVLLMSAWWYWRAKPAEFRTIIGNSRWPRVIHWLLLFAFGLSFLTLTIGRRPGGWNDWLAVAIAALAFYAAWMFAVGMNDIVDQSLDQTASPSRPLPSGRVTGARLAEVSVIFLLVALLAGYLSGPPVLFMVIVFTAAYWVYSVPPLRLKRWVGLNSLLVALACLAATAAGYFILNPAAPLAEMPGRLAWLIVLAFALAANAKDLKDIEGDRQEGIATVPVLLGERRGFLAVSAMVMASFWLVPLVLGWPLLAVTAVPAGLLAWPVVLKKPYREIRVFLLYFAFALASMVLVWAV